MSMSSKTSALHTSGETDDHAVQRVTSLIDGRAAPGRNVIRAVLNPHSGERIAHLSLADPETAAAAIDIARAAQPAWAQLPAPARGAILHRAANLIEARARELSEIVAREAGKSMRDALAETAAAVACARFFAGEGQRLFGRTMPSGSPGKSALTVRQPCGVAALITAANTPAPNFAWKVFPALICGNAVVLKPSEETPLSADWMARTAIEAGVPAGALNVVQGLGQDVGASLVAHPSVDVVSFTGSTRVGRLIAEIAGRGLKKVSLELGGKNAFLVCDDADLETAAKWASASAFSNAGQRCAAASRIIVMADAYAAFVEKFAARAGALRLGVDDDCDLGPVISERQLSAMIDMVGRAARNGARILTGGGRAAGPGLDEGFYMQPTVIEDAAPDAEISVTELFGPVACLYRAESYEDAMRLVNASPYGLTACIHTTSWDRAWTFTREARVGVAVVNGGTFGSEPHMPFGGVGDSGNGAREPGTEAIDVYTELKDIYLLTEGSRL